MENYDTRPKKKKKKINRILDPYLQKKFKVEKKKNNDTRPKKKKKKSSHMQILCDEASIVYDIKFGLYVKNE